MSKKKRRENRGRKKREAKAGWLPNAKKVKKFLTAHWVALLGILISVITGFVIYYLNTAEPDIRFIHGAGRYEQIEKKYRDGKLLTYQKGMVPFKNFSIKSGYVDKVQFTPSALTPSVAVEVLSVEKVSLGWGEQKSIEVRWVIIDDVESEASEVPGKRPFILEAQFFDNKGKQIPNESGGLDSIVLSHDDPNRNP